MLYLLSYRQLCRYAAQQLVSINADRAAAYPLDRATRA
jgi:hypothetical protein